jgi:hypothetical protein
MRPRLGIAILAAAALLAPSAPRASELEVYSSTSLYMQKQWRDGSAYAVTPLYEFVSLSGRGIGIPGGELAVVVDAWGGVNLASGEWWNGYWNTGRWSGDLNLAFVKASWLQGDLQVRLGRMNVGAGNARMLQVDGGAVNARFLRHVTLEAWAGAPTPQRLVGWGSVYTSNPTFGDIATGGRLGFAFGRWVDFGLSTTLAWSSGDFSREDVAVDLKVSPASWIYLLGYLDYSLLARDYFEGFGSQIPEASGSLVFPVTRHLQFTADYVYTVPSLMLASQSILWVFSDGTHQYLGASARVGLEQFGAGLPLTFDVGYRRVFEEWALLTNGQVSGDRVSLRATWKPTKASSVGAEGAWLDPTAQGYWYGRVFGSMTAAGFTGTLDGQGYWFAQDVNGQASSLVASASLGYDLGQGLSVVGAVSGGATPYYKDFFSGMVKLVYNQTYRSREVR